MSFVTKIHHFFNPLLYHRENQIARLFIHSFQTSGSQQRAGFKMMLKEMISEDHEFFLRLGKTDIEMLIWLIDSDPNLFFGESNSISSSLLKRELNNVVEDEFLKLSIENKILLRKIFKENTKFIKYFTIEREQLVEECRSFLEKS
jgi:hypothetical protein